MPLLFTPVLQVLLSLCAFAHASFATIPSETASPQSISNAPPNSPIVYVSFFDLDIVPSRKPLRKPATRSSVTSGAPSTPPASTPKRTSSTSAASAPGTAIDSSEETPADRANALLYAVSDGLIRALQQAGYNAQRLPFGAPLPKTGLRIRGVFAEADEQNRARRLLVGGEAVSPNMILFVGVNNLSRPEQPLYELANPPSNDSRHGPVITVTSYAPAARYELSREPSDEELENLSNNIAYGLTALLRANPLLSAE